MAMYDNGCLYLMFSREFNLTKLGYSVTPGSRLHQTRRERKDYSIELVALWDIGWCAGYSGIDLERMFHVFLNDLCCKHPSQTWEGEWYEIYWPNLASYVESVGALLMPLGFFFRRNPNA